MSSFHMNIPRILGDLSHTASKCILIWAIHSNRSAEGVSLLTQLLYILVFGSRYMDLFWVPPQFSWWNFVLKIFYMSTSAYIVFLMMKVFARTREKEYGWKLAIWCLAGSVASAAPVCILFEGWKNTTVFEVFWTFSIILESVCILPQLLLLRQTSVPTVLDSFYLVTLGAYRFFYILNWMVRAFGDRHYEPTGIVFGIIQTALYVDFAWVYYSRQRVKLRGGGVVDGDDLSRSYLVKRFIGRRGNRNSTDEDDITEEDASLANQENGTIRPSAPRSGRSWGARGISVSADDTLEEHFDSGSRDAQMVDPSHFEDADDDDDADAPPPPAKDSPLNTKPKAATNSSSGSNSEVATPDTEDAVGSSANEWSHK